MRRWAAEFSSSSASESHRCLPLPTKGMDRARVRLDKEYPTPSLSPSPTLSSFSPFADWDAEEEAEELPAFHDDGRKGGGVMWTVGRGDSPGDKGGHEVNSSSSLNGDQPRARGVGCHEDDVFEPSGCWSGLVRQIRLLVKWLMRTGTPAAPVPATTVKKPRNRGFFRSFLCCFRNNASSNNNNNNAHTNCQAPSAEENGNPKSADKYLLANARHQDMNKKCVVIDLDETLVHSSFKPINNADFIVPVEIDGTVHQVYVLKRPHVDEFLQRMGEMFECILFTASLAKYADPVADLLDKWSVFRCRLFRESCVFHRGNYVKDLSRLGRELDQVVIVDNSPASYIFHPDNAVGVTSWFDEMSDTELLDLIPFFEQLARADNVYQALKNFMDSPSPTPPS